MPAPCEACPDDCIRCAWDHEQPQEIQDQDLITLRTTEAYECIQGASVVQDKRDGTAFLKIQNVLLPLSPVYGGILQGTDLGRDISKMAA